MHTLFCVSWATRMRCLRSIQSVNRRIRRIPVSGLIQKSVRTCVQGLISKMALRWHREDVTVPYCWIKSLFLFYFRTKIFSSLHNITIEPLMADGVSWRCFSYSSGPWQCNLLGSQWDSHKPPGFHPKYLKLCSKLLWVRNDMGVSDKCQNCNFGVEYPFNCG